MARQKNRDISVTCPCCGAGLVIDASLRKVISHTAPPVKRTNVPDLGRVHSLLKEQEARREALFRQSAEDEKTKPQLLERKFEEALKKSKGEPVVRPTRDIDLD